MFDSDDFNLPTPEENKAANRAFQEYLERLTPFKAPEPISYPEFQNPGCSHCAWVGDRCVDCGKTAAEIEATK